MLDAFRGNEALGNSTNLRFLSFNNQYFQTIVFI